MSATVMLDTNDIRDICNYLDYVLKDLFVFENFYNYLFVKNNWERRNLINYFIYGDN